MGIICYCYYGDGVISKKFEFVLGQILGTRDLFKVLKTPNQELQGQQTKIEDSHDSKDLKETNVKVFVESEKPSSDSEEDVLKSEQ
jgi:hypothetical protein